MSECDGNEVVSLPPPPANFAGTTQHRDKKTSIEVSNKQGYLCRISLKAEFDAAPEVLFSIFTYPDNSAIFRDIEGVKSRKVLVDKPGYKEVEVEQIGRLKVLWISRMYSTWLKVTEDSRNPEELLVNFDLLQSDVLSRFHGKWVLKPVRDATTGLVVATDSYLEQDVMPKGMPVFLKHVPVLGNVLRSISCKTIQRIVEDVWAVLRKLKKSNKSVHDVMLELCGPTKFASEQIQSHQFDIEDEDGEDEDNGLQNKHLAVKLVSIGLQVDDSADRPVTLTLRPVDTASPAAASNSATSAADTPPPQPDTAGVTSADA